DTNGDVFGDAALDGARAAVVGVRARDGVTIERGAGVRGAGEDGAPEVGGVGLAEQRVARGLDLLGDGLARLRVHRAGVRALDRERAGAGELRRRGRQRRVDRVEPGSAVARVAV